MISTEDRNAILESAKILSYKLNNGGILEEPQHFTNFSLPISGLRSEKFRFYFSKEIIIPKFSNSIQKYNIIFDIVEQEMDKLVKEIVEKYPNLKRVVASDRFSIGNLKIHRKNFRHYIVDLFNKHQHSQIIQCEVCSAFWYKLEPNIELAHTLELN